MWAAVGIVFLFIFFLWATFVSGEMVPNHGWVKKAIAETISWGLLFSIIAIWRLRKEPIEEPTAVEPTPDNEKRYLLYVFSFQTLSMIAMTFLCVWVAVTSNEIDESGSWIYMGLSVLFGTGALYFCRHVFHEIFEARYALVYGDTVCLYYIYLGNWEGSVTTIPIKQKMINHFRLNSDTFSEPMFRVQFGRWRYAILPMDWEDPPKPVPIDPAHQGQLSTI
jgi:hypothetical protein